MSEEVKKNANLEMLKSVLESVQQQIQFADSKAAFVIAFHAFMFGVVFTKADQFGLLWIESNCPMRTIWVVLLVGYLAASAVSMWFAIRVIIPQLGEQAPDCKIFFAHIVKCYKRDHARYASDVQAMTESTWAHDVSTQIVENSNIALVKHQRAKNAAKWSMVVVVLAGALAFLVAVSSVASAKAATPPAITAATK